MTPPRANALSRRLIGTLTIASMVLAGAGDASAQRRRRRSTPMLTFPAEHKAMIENAWLRGGSDAGKAIELTEKTFKFVGDNATTRRLRPRFDALRKQAASSTVMTMRLM